MSSTASIFRAGRFQVGCNYWASHAGMMMWRQWRPDVVADDLKQLADEGLQVLRVFPLWPDFQPLRQLYTGMGRPMELRLGPDERPLGHDPAGRAGVDPEMMDRFAFLADRAEENGLSLIVGLITGWMSGRLFVPPAFERRNVITDPLAQRWQVRFVRHFVDTLKSHPAIAAWDLGNECNCMGPVDSPDEAWAWTELIAGAVRQSDPDRPVVSGMDGLAGNARGDWNVFDQSELTDVLTTHPYPLFTPYCGQDPVHQLRNGFHATAGSRLYTDLGGRPCFAEEMGTLGPMFASEANAAAYLHSALWTLWAHDCRAMLWWCAYDQAHLRFPPYESNACERELGLIRQTREPKPVLKTIAAFRRAVEAMPIDELPACRREAVCLLGDDDDQWALAYASFILAKQAGFDVRFRHICQPLPDAELYLLPGLAGQTGLTVRHQDELMARVRAGASLYVSFADGLFQPFKTFFGLDVQSRFQPTGPVSIRFTGLPGEPVLTGRNAFCLNTRPTTADVLATTPDGNVAFAHNAIGQGAVYYLSFAVESMLSKTPGAFHGPDAQPYHRIYSHVAADVLAARLVRIDHPTVTVTEHPLDASRAVVVIVNHAPADAGTTPAVCAPWRIAETWHGPAATEGTLLVPANEAVVLLLTRSA